MRIGDSSAEPIRQEEIDQTIDAKIKTYNSSTMNSEHPKD